MNNKTRADLEILIHIFIILIFLGLAGKIYFESYNYSCGNCAIVFKNTRPANGPTFSINVSPYTLYNGFVKDECPIIWDRVNGYMKNG